MDVPGCSVTVSSPSKVKRRGLTLCRKLKSEQDRPEAEGVVHHCNSSCRWKLFSRFNYKCSMTFELQKMLHPGELFLWLLRLRYLLITPYCSPFVSICDL